jgi:hypothetical protein
MDFNYLAIRRSGPFAFLMRYFMKFPVRWMAARFLIRCSLVLPAKGHRSL